MTSSSKLSPAPEVPSWLDSLCSQIDIFKDVKLPQVFTPRDQRLPEKQSSYSGQQLEYENDRDSNGQLSTNSNTLQRKNAFQYYNPNHVDLKSNLPSTQFEADSSRLSQPWPSLQLLPAGAGSCSVVEDVSNGNMHESNGNMHEMVDSSQPWPSCDVRVPASQSCRITDSRLTSSYLAPVSLSQKGPRNKQDQVLDSENHFPSSPTYSPSISPQDTLSTFQFHAPSKLATNEQVSQVVWRKPMKKTVLRSKKSSASTFQPSRGEKPGSNANGIQREPLHRPTSTIAPLKSQIFQRPAKTTVVPGSVFYTPVSGSYTGTTRDVHALVSGGDGDFSQIQKDAGGNSSATPQSRTDCNPYSPALIIFQGAGGKGTKLRSVEEIPTPYRDIFPFPFFNAVQSMAFDQLLYTDSSVVVSAPTGSGKTVLFELAMVRLMLCARIPLRDIKVVYIGPMKSLCGERVDDWRQKLSPLGLQCLELTGDSNPSDFTNLHHVQVICTTPEKWDSVTRRWKDNRQLFQSICLVCIDEVHVVGDSQRGATVEAVITRMKMVQTLSANAALHPIRFVAVSATLPNTEDIAEWLSSPLNPASVFKLGEEYRPVRLQRVVLGYPFPEGSSEFRFDLSLTYKLHSVIDNYCHGKPTLVFCSSRKSCQQTAETLVKRSWGHSSFVLPQFRQDITAAANRIKERKLSELLMSGVGVHHAGLEVQDRRLIEELFRGGKLAILISTSTLSVGVNLPAHLVIVKATHMYVMGVAREYSDQQVLQMIGRAGRPQFDTSATVVIMTKAQLKTKYEALVNGKQVIESMLHKNLTEHVNVEVVLNTITDMADAASWLSHTLLHVRATKNPRHYGLSAGLTTEQVEKKLQDLCMTAINRLNSLQLVSVDPDTAMTSPTERGRLMARYCLEFQTMKLLSDIPAKSTMEHLIKMLASCPEFLDIQLRTSEKKTLNALNKNKNQETIRYPMQGKIKTKQMKVNCLIQAGLGCLHIQDYSLSQDLLKIFRVGQRITKCLMELQWLGLDYTTLLETIKLCKAFKARLWPDSKHVARQLEGIGPTISQALVVAGLTSFQQLESADPQHLQLVVNRHPPFGNRVRDAVNCLPRYELIIQQVKNYQASTAHLVICVSMLNAEDMKNSPTCGIDHQIVTIIGDEDNNITFKWKLSDRMLLSEKWQRSVHVKRAVAGPSLHVGLISLDWVGLDIHTEYQPAYTMSFHPQEHVKQAQPDTGRMQPSKRGRAAPAAARERTGKRPGQPSSKSRGNKAGGKIQQQLDVMHSKLQHFQYTKRKTPDELTRDTAVSGHRDTPVFPKGIAAQQTSRPLCQRSTPDRSADKGPAASCASDTPWTSCHGNGLLSPESDLQAAAWGDLVSDFWEEDDFDEPPCKVAKATERPGGKGPATDLANISAGAGCIQPTTSNQSYRPQPDVRVFGNVQNTSQVNNDSSRQSLGPGSMTIESSATCTVGGISAGTGAVNSVNSHKVGTSGPKAGSGIESTSRNVSNWKGFSVPDEAPFSVSASVKNSAAHNVCSENIAPLGAYSISSNATHSGVHNVNQSIPQSGVHSVNQSMPQSGFHSVNQNMPQSGFHSVNQNMPQSGSHIVNQNMPQSGFHSVNQNMPQSGSHIVNQNMPQSGFHSVNQNMPQSGFHSVNQNMPQSGFHSVNQNMPQSGFHSVNQNMPQSGSHIVNQNMPQSGFHSVNQNMPQSGFHSVNQNMPQSGFHSVNQNMPQSGSHIVNQNMPQSGSHSVNQNMPQSGSHIVNQNMPQSGFHSVNQNMPQSGFHSLNQSGIHSVRAMGRTPVVKMGSGAATPGLSGKVNTPKVKLSLMEGSMDKPAASEQIPVTELGGKRQADDTGNVSSGSGSGWEHLNLYHSNRESMVYQGDAEELSEAGEDRLPFSQISDSHIHQHLATVRPVMSPQQHMGYRLVGMTSPGVSGIAQNSQELTQERTLHYPDRVTTENLLEGIF